MPKPRQVTFSTYTMVTRRYRTSLPEGVTEATLRVWIEDQPAAFAEATAGALDGLYEGKEVLVKGSFREVNERPPTALTGEGSHP